MDSFLLSDSDDTVWKRGERVLASGVFFELIFSLTLSHFSHLNPLFSSVSLFLSFFSDHLTWNCLLCSDFQSFIASCLLSFFDFPLHSSITSSCHFQSFSPLHLSFSTWRYFVLSLSLSCPLSLYRNSRHSSLVTALVFVFPTTSEWVYVSKHLCVSQTQG